MTTALITGITGQDGRLMAKYLYEKGYKVHGLVRKSVSRRPLSDYEWYDYVTVHYGDVDTYVPESYDEVYHFAAQSHVGYSFTHVEETWKTNVVGTSNMLAGVFKANPHAKFFFAGTSEMFGEAKGTQNEHTPFEPRSPYAISKVVGYYMAMYYRAMGRFVAIGITMNHESEIRGEDFVTRKITSHLAHMFVDPNYPPLHLGNVTAIRDWGYAPEFIDAFYKIMQLERPETFVIGTGKNYTVEEFLITAIRSLYNKTVLVVPGGNDTTSQPSQLHYYITTQDGKTEREIAQTDARLLRPMEAGGFCADYRKLTTYTGWRPHTNITGLIKKMLASDIDAVREEENKGIKTPQSIKTTDL